MGGGKISRQDKRWVPCLQTTTATTDWGVVTPGPSLFEPRREGLLLFFLDFGERKSRQDKR
jgi:hypothetical protein